VPEAGAFRPADHMFDHWLAGNIGQRLSRQAGSGHSGRDQDQNVASHG
jgi:hypothetical protein